MSKLIWRQSSLVRPVAFTVPANHLERGCLFRFRNQMPVMSGSGNSVRDIVGSVRQLRINQGKLTGSLRWCDDSEAGKVRDKFNAGILQLKLETVELEFFDLRPRQEYQGLRGPLSVVTQWQPVAVRLVANTGGSNDD